MSLRKLVCTAAVAAFLVIATPPAGAVEQSQPDEVDALPFLPAPATQVWATRSLSAQPGQQQPQFLRLDIAQLTPRFVTSDSPATVTITGKIVNVGDRKVSDIVLRLERGQPLATEDELRKALREPAAAEAVQPRFTPVAGALEPGQQADFSLTVPLRGSEPTSLEVEQPGIYPILANVNGKPDFGGQARLAALSTLLPVLGVPGGETKGKQGAPAKLTVLWPIADRPRLVRLAGGGQSELIDDELTTSLSVNGRLYGLLQAYEQAISSMSTAMCLAIDPDLLRTVQAMSTGYKVRGGTDGKGQVEAKLWLDRLKLAVTGRCVVALPSADADLVALTRAKLGTMRTLAVTDGPRLIQDVLSVQPLPDLVWPEDGVLDQPTFDELVTPQPDRRYPGVKSLLLDPAGLTDAQGTAPVGIAGQHPVTAVKIDSMVSDALQGSDSRPRTLSGVAAPVESQPVSVQNALSVLVFRAGWQGDGRNVLVAPPRRWNAPLPEMTEFLTAAQKLLAGGYAAQTGLGELTSATPAVANARIAYPAEAGAREISPIVANSVTAQSVQLNGVVAAMQQEDSEHASPADLADPLWLGLLRAMSGAWRSNEQGARSAAEVSQSELDALTGMVGVTQPNSPILLGSGDSPIPVTITNRLDVRMTVRITLADTPGIRKLDLADQVLPARGERVVRVPVEVLRSGRFPVNVRLTTPEGVALGDTVKLEVSSSAYGTITVIVTVIAGIALVLLSGRRIYKRVRARNGENGDAPSIENVTPEKSSA
ncbi:hypothetical protein SAMN05216188_101205 [Lentzea xinjiangensis]|uniref:Glycoprotein n=1 Tax=Lentzea xinjiangensis TaxID=402600 RepID=A0A1H9A0K4_9PSEU|nr:DUF6049 family protein [Lentzea xinjiangensis]SEP69528.1 hypothetical protein SAMN05216188_101205 [Lentzea xinjiangensis]